MVRGAVLRHVPATLHVVGEVGELSRPSSGHLYLTLKDRDSELRCVVWRSVAAGLRFAVECGLELLVTGEIEVYTPRGTYQLVARRVEPRGVGALDLAFRQLRERLGREGLFDPARKRPLPRIPFRIGIVTSPTGAAVRDVLRTLQRRFPAAEMLVYPARVQGAGAAAEVAAGIAYYNQRAESLGGIDVLIVTRGGGSQEDLWAFNEEALVRAVAGSRIPVVSGVGHEVDITLCDLVADVRAATPTAAAEIVTPDVAGLWDHILQHAARAERLARHALSLRREWLRTACGRQPLARPLARWEECCRQRKHLQQRVQHATAHALRTAGARLSEALLSTVRVGPGAMLARMSTRLEHAARRLELARARYIRTASRRIETLLLRAERHGPDARLQVGRERIVSVVNRCKVAAHHLMESRRAHFAGTRFALEACNPRAVLRRGYAIVRDGRRGQVIRSIEQVRAGQTLRTEVTDGEFNSVAEDPHQMRLF